MNIVSVELLGHSLSRTASSEHWTNCDTVTMNLQVLDVLKSKQGIGRKVSALGTSQGG